MKVILIRHGKTRGNLLKRYIGTTDEELCSFDGLDRRYPDCDRVISSPMKRCIRTAEYIYPNKEIIVCENLRECDFGEFENKSFEDMKDDERYREWVESGGTLPFPCGEARGDFVRRSVGAFLSQAFGASAAFVVHGGTVMAVMSALYGGDFYDYMTENGGGYIFEFDEKTASVLSPPKLI